MEESKNINLAPSFSINDELLENKNHSKKNSYKYTIIIISLIISIVTLIILFISFEIKNNNNNNNNNNNKLKNNQPLNKTNDNNDICENLVFEKFCNLLPSFLKSDSNGNFHLDRSGFKLIPNSKKQYKEEHNIRIDKMYSNQMSKMNGDIDSAILFDIVILHSDLNFKREVNEIINQLYTYDSYSFVAKIEIGSINFVSDELYLDDSFKNKILKLANQQNYTDIEKARELDNLIQTHGYYIPLKIYFGGLFILESEDIEQYTSKEYLQKLEGKLEAEFELKFNDTNKVNISGHYKEDSHNIFNELYSISKKVVLGGDIKKDNFEDWRLSINNKNSEIISYDNIIKITYLFDEELKLKLKEPLRIIDEKYENRKNFMKQLINYKK